MRTPGHGSAALVRVVLAALLVASVLGAAPTPSGEDPGDDWAIEASPNAIADEHNFVNDVDCPSASECWAAGYYWSGDAYQPLILRRTGEAWTLADAPTPGPSVTSHLYGVDCPSVSECWAVGYQWTGEVYEPLVLRWDGESWSIVPAPAAASDLDYRYLYGVECTGPSECWAVGFDSTVGTGRQALVLRWDGAAWSQATIGTPVEMRGTTLVSMSCVAADDCWAAGYRNGTFADRTLTVHWDGAAWSVVASPSTADDQRSLLSHVSCLSATDCWAVGTYSTSVNRTLALRWNGERWTIVPTPNATPTGEDRANTLFAVSCVAADDCSAVGYSKPGNTLQTLVLRWDGASWALEESANTSPGQTNTLRAVSCRADSGCVAAGNYYGAQSRSRTLTMRRGVGPPPWNGPAAAQVEDAAGDANLVAPTSGLDLSSGAVPASIDSADLRSIGLQTVHDTIEERGADGAVEAVRHVPTGVRLQVTTTAPPSPTFGPTVAFAVPVTIGPSCRAVFTMYVAGGAPGAVDRDDAELVPQEGCEGAGSVAGSEVSHDGATISATFSFEDAAGLLEDGTRVWAWTRPAVRAVVGAGDEASPGPVIDDARVLADFVVGSDLPPDAGG